MRSTGIVAKFSLEDASSKVPNDGADLAGGETTRWLVLQERNGIKKLWMHHKPS